MLKNGINFLKIEKKIKKSLVPKFCHRFTMMEANVPKCVAEVLALGCMVKTVNVRLRFIFILKHIELDKRT